MFRKVVWQHMQEVVGLLIITLLRIYQGIFQRKNENLSRFDRVMAITLWSHFSANPVNEVLNAASTNAFLLAYN